MTETEWLKCANSLKMLEYMRGKVSDRKLHLFVAACARTLRPVFGVEHDRVAEMQERYADRQVSKDEFIRFYTPDWLFAALYPGGIIPPNAHAPLQPAWDSARSAAFTAVDFTHMDTRDNTDSERASIAFLLFDIFGNPFRTIAINPSWLTCNVTELAQAIYDDRAFDQMPVLATALEKAGCDNAEILNHCGGPGPHVRGCWALDVILGQE